jgi:hypothetical protein
VSIVAGDALVRRRYPGQAVRLALGLDRGGCQGRRARYLLELEVVADVVDAPGAESDGSGPEGNENHAGGDATVFEEIPHGDSFFACVHAANCG